MRVLYVNTCQDALAALAVDGKTVAVARETTPRRQVENLGTLLDSLPSLAGENRPHLVIASRGPALFTGLRAGLVFAKSLGFAWNVPVWGVGELEYWAVDAFSTHPGARAALVVRDARRGEVYWGLFTRAAASAPLETVIPVQVSAPAALGPALAERGWDLSDPALLQVGWDGQTPHELATEAAVEPALEAAAQAGLTLPADLWTLPEIPAELRSLTPAQLESAGLGLEPLYLRAPDVQMPGK